MKTCPQCNTDNPDNAHFCRHCRYNFDETGNRYGNRFTPEQFPDIKLQPRSVYEISFFSLKTMFVKLSLFVVWGIFLHFFFIFVWYDIHEDLGLSYGKGYDIQDALWWITMLLFAVFVILNGRKIYLFLSYWLNAEYIEQGGFMGDVCRIARKGKLGLFDVKRQLVLLSSKYDNITKFDSEHILVEIEPLKGIYSLKKHTIIIPIKFDRINSFENSMATAFLGSESYHYDVNGNRMS